MQPSLPLARAPLWAALICKGMRDEHLAFQREWIANDPERAAAFEQGLAEGGYEGAMRAIADVLTARYGKPGRVQKPGFPLDLHPFHIAAQYLDVGDYERAIDWLEKAYEVHHPGLPYIGFYPHWDPLRSDPRFQDLLRRMNLPTEARSDPDGQI